MSKLKELIDELCPDGVEYRSLKTLTVKPSSIKWANEDGIRCYIDLASVDIATHNILETAEVDRDNAPSRARQIVKHNDVLFATTRPTQMRFCLVPDEYDDQLCSTGFCVLRANDDTLDQHYLYHAIGTSSFCSYVEANQTQGNYPAVSDAVVKEFRIPVPPIEVQREIARVLDAMQELDDALSDEYEKRRVQFAYCRHSLIGDLDSSLLTELGEVADFQLGKMLDSAKNKGEYRPYLRNINVQQGRFDLTDIQDMRITEEEREKYRVRGGDILMCEGGVPGRCAIWRDDGAEIYFQKALHRIRCDCEKVLPDYCYLAISDAVENGLYDDTFTGSAIQHAPARVVKKWKIPVPDAGTQRRLVESLGALIALCESVESELVVRRKQFEYYRDRLLDLPEKAVL